MSIHASKRLEFPLVVLALFSARLFNVQESIKTFASNPELGGGALSPSESLAAPPVNQRYPQSLPCGLRAAARSGELAAKIAGCFYRGPYAPACDTLIRTRFDKSKMARRAGASVAGFSNRELADARRFISDGCAVGFGTAYRRIQIGRMMALADAIAPLGRKYAARINVCESAPRADVPETPLCSLTGERTLTALRARRILLGASAQTIPSRGRGQPRAMSSPAAPARARLNKTGRAPALAPQRPPTPARLCWTAAEIGHRAPHVLQANVCFGSRGSAVEFAERSGADWCALLSDGPRKPGALDLTTRCCMSWQSRRAGMIARNRRSSTRELPFTARFTPVRPACATRLAKNHRAG